MGYKQEEIKLREARKPCVPCMNPYFKDIYFDEIKFAAATNPKKSPATYSNQHSQMSQQQNLSNFGVRHAANGSNILKTSHVGDVAAATATTMALP